MNAAHKHERLVAFDDFADVLFGVLVGAYLGAVNAVSLGERYDVGLGVEYCSRMTLVVLHILKFAHHTEAVVAHNNDFYIEIVLDNRG